ncbi:MAG: hypothetical protein H6591_13870 [Flavobacteriales bacterium]|nr:hypothetical protein [Flavobacteriales bacterium]
MSSTEQSQGKSGSDAIWYQRYRSLRFKWAMAVGLIALIFGGIVWLKDHLLVIRSGSGVPLGSCVRTDTHIASLIQTLEPYTPSLHHAPSTDRYRVSLLLIPLDGGGDHVVPIAEGLIANNMQLSRVLGSDGATLWLEVNGLYGVRLKDHKLFTAQDLHDANPALDEMLLQDPRGMDVNEGRLHLMASDRSRAFDIDPATWKAVPAEPRPSNSMRSDPPIGTYMAAGLFTSREAWLGVLSESEREGSFRPKRWLRAVESADDVKQSRSLCIGAFEGETDDGHRRIASMTPLSDTEYLNAAFLRMDAKSEPIRLAQPNGALMLWTSAPGLKGTLMVARVDDTGKVLWMKDTAIDRFRLQQILPGERITAFVGTRIAIPDKVSEPIIVLLDHATGELSTHFLWR